MPFTPKQNMPIIDFDNVTEAEIVDDSMRLELKKGGEIVAYIRCPLKTSKGLADIVYVALNPPV